MRVAQRQIVEHTAIVRALADKTIEARQPGLINLPLPLPSVPVLTPLLSPLVSGNNGNGNGNGNGNSGSDNGNGNSGSDNGNGNGNGNGGTTTTTSAAAASTSTTSSGDSGGSSSGSSSGSSGDGSSSSSSGSSSGSSGDGSSSGSSAGNSGTTTSTASGSSSSGTTGDGTSSTDGSGAGGSVLSSSGTNNVTSGSSGTSGEGSSSGSGGSTVVGGVANAGQRPSTGSTTGSISTSSMGAGGFPGSTDQGGTTGGTVSGGTSQTTTQGSAKHGLSGGATAGIIICLLALLFGLLIFFVRRRTRSRRDERVNRWWFSRNRTSQTYGDRNSREIIPTGVQSVRSSFATTVDHGTFSNHSNPPSSRNSQFIIPPLPPMAQIGRGNGAAPTMIIDTSYFNSANANAAGDNRFSIGSANSESQYLVVNNRESLNPDLGTPMSVRPFSPSESFAFPKPPDPTSRPNSSATLAMSSPNKTLPSSIVMPLPPTPGLPTLAFDNNPINNVMDPFKDDNPFEDPFAAVTVSPPTAPLAGFAATEFICRPFHPTLPDELAVKPQDPVRVLQTFDDGWALVEKIRVDDPKGKRKESDGIEKGLIPLDCLRAPGQELPDFFAAKRVSSYAGSTTGSGLGFQVL